MSAIAVVDCGMGNLHSVIAGARRACPDAALAIADSAAAVDAADKVIFPGDGNFGACMREIDARGLRGALTAAARDKPFLGICVGMQVLFERSEEAEASGLGVFKSDIRRLPRQVKTPHIGWNTARSARRHPLINPAADGEYFYFIHSYYAPPGEWTLMTCEYGLSFSAVIGSGRLLATQFHPEKSGQHGRQLLENFLAA